MDTRGISRQSNMFRSTSQDKYFYINSYIISQSSLCVTCWGELFDLYVALKYLISTMPGEDRAYPGQVLL